MQLQRLGEVCWHSVTQKRHRAMLAAWRRWAAAKRTATAQQQQAALHFVARTAHAALLTWRLAVAAKAARRQQQEQAAAHWAQWRAALVLVRWRRWAALRRRAPEARVLYLLHSSVNAWRREAARKASKAARQRLAMRQCYLRQLWAGWAAWQQHRRRQQQKGQQLEAMRLYRSSVLLHHCWAAWQGPFLTAARSKRMATQLAEQHAECKLLRQALAAWRDPFMAQARQLRELQHRADAFRAAALLRTTLDAWCLWCTWQAEKQHRVEAAQALLRPGRLRRLLLAWLSVCASRAHLRRQVGRGNIDMQGMRLQCPRAAWLLSLSQNYMFSAHSLAGCCCMHSGSAAHAVCSVAGAPAACHPPAAQAQPVVPSTAVQQPAAAAAGLQRMEGCHQGCWSTAG